MGFAAGKHAKFISDRSGAAFPYKEMRIEWNGSRVHTSEYEEKQPQLTPAKHISDAEALRYASTARVEPAVEVLLQRNAFRSGAAGSSTITVTEPGHGRTTGDTVCYRDVTPFERNSNCRLYSRRRCSSLRWSGNGGRIIWLLHSQP